MDFTEEQQNVIDSRESDLLVSAAAGSGKTAVLSARILSLLTDKKHPADIDRMLIVTFTRAAAAEMRERIGKAIAGYCADNPEDKHMDRQGALLNNAQITTIDSFCLFVVKNNFADIDLDPGFRILDEGERQLMLGDCLDELLEEKYSEGEEDYLRFMDGYCSGVNDSKTKSMLLALLQDALSVPAPEEWLKAAAADIAPEDPEHLNDSSWYGYGRKKADRLIGRMKELALEVLDICSNTKGVPDSYTEAASALRNTADILMSDPSYTRRHQITGATVIPALKSGKKADADPEMTAEAKQRIDTARKIYKKICSLYSFGEAELSAANSILGKNAQILCGLCLELKQRFDEKKREQGVVDFNDMEHFALKILRDKDMKPTRTALEYRDHFEHIFVDEYQDSNYLQEYILKSIAQEDNYYCVGDVKQSIYSFRQARPELFMEKYRDYGEKNGGELICLNRNFRSREEVLDFVNLIFEGIMREDTAGMDYDDGVRLYAQEGLYRKAVADEYKAEIDVMITADEEKAADEDTDGAEDEDADEDEGGSREELECRMVAERIRELKHDGLIVFDKENDLYRPVGYGDIVLIASSVKPYEKALRNIFEQYDIPLYLNATTGYFKAPEVKCLVSALKVIDNPMQDRPLHSTLTDFLEMTDEDEMARIRAAVPEGSLYKAIKEYAAQKDDELSAKLEAFFEWLGRYREYSRYLKVRELIAKLLRESGYLDRMSAMPGGAGRRANLKLLMERASDYEQTGYRGLYHFVRYLAQLKKQEIESGEATVLDGEKSMVRCMTIHKSKGLEFPVVICLGFYKQFNKRGRSADVVVDAALGIGMDAVDPVLRAKYPGCKRRYLLEKKKDDDLAEQMRKLYVALTRAREKIIITDLRKADRGSVQRRAESYDIGNAESFDSLIYMALDEKGIADEYVRYYEKDSSLAGTVKEMGRAFGDKDILLGDAIPADEGLRSRIMTALERRYGHGELKGLYTKTSVSDLKHEAYDEEESRGIYETDTESAYTPTFIAETDESSGASRGSAYHRMLELIDHKAIPEEGVRNWIEQSIERERHRGRLTEEYAGLIRSAAIEKFLDHDESRRMRAADMEGKLWREQQFIMALSAKELDPDFPEEEKVLVQGVIDAFWQEGDALVLLDYKTDRVDKPEELIKRHKKQIELYAEALERLKGLKVKERLIYSFTFDRFISL